MIPAPVMDVVELAAIFLVVISLSTLLLFRRFRLEGEALREIDRFMQKNSGLMRAGGDEFFERWVVINYICNSFGLTRSHYGQRVEEMKHFIMESAVGTS